FGQFFWSRHRNVAGLWWSQYHILELTLFVPVLIERRHRCRRHFHITGDTLGDLPAQDRASLILDETAFSKASLADELFECARSNWPLGPRKDGSAVIRCAISSFAKPSCSFFACSSRAASAISCPSSCRSRPRARASSGVIGRPT